MALHLIGLGLHGLQDITLAGLERARSCQGVYAEFYTALLQGASAEALGRLVGKPVQVLDRQGVEEGMGRLVQEASHQDVALLVAGDPLVATTHQAIVQAARAAGVQVHVTHAASILTAAPGLLGLMHYKFGRTTTLARPEGCWLPTSPLEAIKDNRERGLHTLVLLDIQAHRDYCMSASEALALMLQLAAASQATWLDGALDVGVVARAGSAQPVVRTGRLDRLAKLDFGPPLHCLVVPGAMHDAEAQAWASHAV